MFCLSVSQCTNLQPLVDGLSCSELSRLKALELLGGDGLWEFELKAKVTTDVCFRATTLTGYCTETQRQKCNTYKTEHMSRMIQ